MGKIRISSDVDGVILDQGKLLLPYLNKANKNIKSVQDIVKYNLLSYGMTPEDIEKMFNDFEFTGQFLTMDAVPDSIEIIKSLSNQGYLLDIITARTHYELVGFDTEFNLRRVGLEKGKDYQELFCDPEKLKRMRKQKSVFMIEDCPDNIYDLSTNGIYCACIAQPWNKEVKDNSLVKRLSWPEIPDWVGEVNDKFN